MMKQLENLGPKSPERTAASFASLRHAGPTDARPNPRLGITTRQHLVLDNDAVDKWMNTSKNTKKKAHRQNTTRTTATTAKFLPLPARFVSRDV